MNLEKLNEDELKILKAILSDDLHMYEAMKTFTNEATEYREKRIAVIRKALS